MKCKELIHFTNLISLYPTVSLISMCKSIFVLINRLILKQKQFSFFHYRYGAALQFSDPVRKSAALYLARSLQHKYPIVCHLFHGF